MEKRSLKVNDEAMLRVIEIKSRLGKKLTVDEEKALDPDDATPGVTRSEIFADRVEKLKKQEASK